MEDQESARKYRQDCPGITSETLGEETVELAVTVSGMSNTCTTISRWRLNGLMMRFDSAIYSYVRQWQRIRLAIIIETGTPASKNHSIAPHGRTTGSWNFQRIGCVHETFRRNHKLYLRCYEEALRIRDISQGDDSAESGLSMRCLTMARKPPSAFMRRHRLVFVRRIPNTKDSRMPLLVRESNWYPMVNLSDALEQYARARTLRTERDGEEESQRLLTFLEAEAPERSGRKDDAPKLLLATLDMYKITVGSEHPRTVGDPSLSWPRYSCLVETKPCLEVAHEILSHNETR